MPEGPTLLPPPPPAGSLGTPDDQAKTAAYCNGLALEDYQRQSSIGLAGLWGRCQANMELYLYSRRFDRPSGKYRAYKIQNAQNSNAAIQTATPPKLQLKQITTGSPPKWMFNAAAAPPNLFADMPEQDQPLDDDQVAILQGMIMEAAAVSAATGQPPAISPDILLRVDDFALKNALQDVTMSKFQAGGGIGAFHESVLYSGIIGWQFTSQKWDKINRRPKYRQVEPMCAHCDSTKTNIAEMEYYQEDEFLGMYEALQMYDGDLVMQAVIRKNAQGGRPMLASQVPYNLPAFWKSQFFYREVVILRTTYIRNQPYPLTPEEAKTRGQVIPMNVDVESPNAEPVAPVESGADVVGDGGGAGGGGLVQPVAPKPQRLAHFAVGEDGQPDLSQEVAFPNPGMIRYGLREIVMCAGKVVSDNESKRPDIPAWHNKNIPIPFTPWGQGEPERLERLEEAYSNCLTDIVVNGEYATSPAQITVNDVVKDNPRLANNAYTRPGNMYVVSAATWQAHGANMGKPLIQTIQPPATPPDQWRRLPMLDGIIDDTSDRSAALRGESPSNNPSGRLVEALQSAGTSVVTFKSQNTEGALAYGFKLLIGDILLNMTPEELALDFPKYPEYIWRVLHERWVKHYLLCDLEVQIASGGQAAQNARANMMITARQVLQGGPSMPTILEAMDLDPDEEQTKEAEYQRKGLQAQAMGPQPQQTAPNGKPQNGKPQNGQQDGRPQPQPAR